MESADEIRNSVRRLQAQADALSPPLADGIRTNRLIYSGIETFYPTPPFMYVGLRPAGGDSDARREWPQTQHLFDAGNRYSAILDESWHGSTRGNDGQQVGVQAVFALLAGDSLDTVRAWTAYVTGTPESRLSTGAMNLIRNTPMAHIDPFRIDLVKAGRVRTSSTEGRAIGLELIAQLRPRVLICDGNADGARFVSAWAHATATGLCDDTFQSERFGPNYSLKEAELITGTLNGTLVLGLPTLARTKGRNLASLLGLLATRIPNIRARAAARIGPPE